MVAQKSIQSNSSKDYSVSVIVPCKNEKGTIEEAVQRIPEMGNGTEIVFCDDKSTDGTAEEIERVKQRYPGKKIKLVHGPGINKARNVWTGFDAACGDVFMILDADLTIAPEELPSFFEVLKQGRGEFINGSRMIHPIAQNAMPLLNKVGNRFFSACLSFVLGQKLTDTLCGTKAFWSRDWAALKRLIGSWGVEDPWGDHELLYGAAVLHLKIVEMPVHYGERVFGETKMRRRLAHGLIMLRMCVAAFRRFRFP